MNRPAPDGGVATVASLPFTDVRSRALLDSLARLAADDGATVLLLGEAGTGKDVFARALHDASPRAAGPFVSLNCGACAPADLDRALLGCEAGAAPGAFAASPGALEQAHGGTLFLDEIDRLPPALQASLMQTLAERACRRLGASDARPADLRLVAASAANLDRAISRARLLPELRALLDRHPLRVPALRERPGDILPLAHRFLARLRAGLNYRATRFSADAERRLLRHAWPGNLRELENVVHHALFVCPGDEILGEHLAIGGMRIAPATDASTQAAADDADTPSAEEALRAALERLCAEAPDGLHELVERSLMQVAFAHCGRNQVRTAQLLGVSRNVLRGRLIGFGEIEARR
ncbi:sigma 54-interacting transcriptional regulator [Derxia gummosa]|uniref:Sigma 54-interacting transcriptional regulator n=1 Tax=Derxia gummosa DSM 723 TaxID=1121388 RepID=A0A8B6X8P6_9BURK|nr:sigma 54-interacting transcriptional regulator [Derxia gummosa]